MNLPPRVRPTPPCSADSIRFTAFDRFSYCARSEGELSMWIWGKKKVRPLSQDPERATGRSRITGRVRATRDFSLLRFPRSDPPSRIHVSTVHAVAPGGGVAL